MHFNQHEAKAEITVKDKIKAAKHAKTMVNATGLNKFNLLGR